MFKKSGKQYDSKLIADKEGNFSSIRGSDISTYAREHHDELCIDTHQYFLDTLASYLQDLGCLFLPLGGIYLTSSVLTSNRFMLE
jgi:glucokinase